MERGWRYTLRRNLERVMGGAPSRAEEVRIVQAGGRIDEYFGPVSAAEIMLSSSHDYGGTPEVCRCPSSVWAPEVALMRGNRFFIVPFRTVFHLVRRQSCNGISTTSTTPCIVRRSNSGASSEPRQSAESSSGEQKVDSSIESLDTDCNVLDRSPVQTQIVDKTASKIRPALEHQQAGPPKHRRAHSEQKENVFVREKTQPKSSKWHREGFRLKVETDNTTMTHHIPKNLNRVLHQLSDDERARFSAADRGRSTESLRKRRIEDAVGASQRRLKLADHLDDERRDVLRGLQQHQNAHGRSDTEEMTRRCRAGIVPGCSEAVAASSPQRLPLMCVARLTKVARCEKNAYVVPKNMKQDERNPSSSAMVTRSDSRIKNISSSVAASGSSRGHPIKMAYNHFFEKGKVDKERDQETAARVERLKLATGSDWVTCTWSCNEATRRSSSQVRRRVDLSPYLVEEVKDRKRALQQLQDNGKLERRKPDLMVNRKNGWISESNAENVADGNSSWQKKQQYIVEFEGDDRSSGLAYEVLDSKSLPENLFQHLHQLYTGSISISDILSSEQLARINEAAKAPRSSSSHKRQGTDTIVDKHKELDRKRTSILLKMLQTGKAQLGTSEPIHLQPKAYNNKRASKTTRLTREATENSATQSKSPGSSESFLISRRPKLAEFFNAASTAIMQTPRDHTLTDLPRKKYSEKSGTTGIDKKMITTLQHHIESGRRVGEDTALNSDKRLSTEIGSNNDRTGFKSTIASMEDLLTSEQHNKPVFSSLFVPESATISHYKRRSSRRSRRHRGPWQPHLATLNECSP